MKFVVVNQYPNGFTMSQANGKFCQDAELLIRGIMFHMRSDIREYLKRWMYK
jgi:hypothetical protein